MSFPKVSALYIFISPRMFRDILLPIIEANFEVWLVKMKF